MFKFEFSEEMVRIIGDVLSSAPYRTVAPILAEMQKQIAAQSAGPPPNAATNIAAGNGKPQDVR